MFDCEYRSYGDQIAYCCMGAGKNEYPDLEAFAEWCRKHEPVYDGDMKRLTAEGMELVYEKREDVTQYI